MYDIIRRLIKSNFINKKLVFSKKSNQISIFVKILYFTFLKKVSNKLLLNKIMFA